MKKLLTLLLVATAAVSFATSNPVEAKDPLEINFIENPRQTWDYNFQQILREQSNWQNFIAEHGTWFVYFNESNQKPHRAYGQPIPVAGSTSVEMAYNFIAENLDNFGVNPDDLTVYATPTTKKHQMVNFKQQFQGIHIMNSRLVVKINNGQVVMFGADIFDDIEVDILPSLSTAEVISAAVEDMTANVEGVEINEELQILAIPHGRTNHFHLVYTGLVKTMSDTGIPAHYYTLIDAHTGEILYRQNRIQHLSNGDEKDHNKTSTPASPAVMPDITGQVQASLYTESIIFGESVVGLPNLSVSLGSTEYFCDGDGNMNFPVTGPTTATFKLQGPWSRVFTGGSTPQFTASLQDGANNISFDGDANIKELSAYRSVNIVHDHCKAIMPSSFTGMDFQLATNVDVTGGECNAFYDGSSINFYSIGGGCNATSQVADVVYHEYGHGINDNYYQSLDSFFMNGAMGEGYADYWAISITDNPHLGQGFYTDSNDGIRRYDLEPKIFPQDLVGEVHADGEIIMGAWYDTHLLMGSDWSITDDLFVQAYAGLQAEVFNGSEGFAFVDVLLDVLQADDDDNDIANGTPHGDAILEGFAMHGITLVANAMFSHIPVQEAVAEQGIEIQATIILDFPFINYLDEGQLFYRINNSTTWETVPLQNTLGNSYVGTIPAQSPGTVVAYYLGLVDVFGNFSSVHPTASAEEEPNLPYFILVGMDNLVTDDSDFDEPWGAWETGVLGDNNTTGDWELNLPIGSFSEPGNLSTVVAPYTQTTPNGEFCFLTGQSPTQNGGIGENDIDGGHTTLRSSVIDLTDYENPVFTYMRWYVNAPPSGANPGADWWQVQISDDGGNTWTYIENTKTQDISWRRNAFRVQDYVDITTDFRIQMIASDSTHIGEYLDGGSLIEAAVDDIKLWDLAEPDNVSEWDWARSFTLFPNPVDDQLHLSFYLPDPRNISLKITDMTGRVVWTDRFTSTSVGRQQLDVSTKSLPSGMYSISLVMDSEVLSKTFQVIR